MACTNDKFVINKGLSNEFTFTIKQNDSTLPMTIETSDTFEATLYKLEDNSVVGTANMTNGMNGQITVYDASNGQIKLVLKDALVDTLELERGAKADYYYAKAMYRMAIECNTTNNGNFIAKVDKVYVR